ncbi:hypothetical protein [Streptomyces sp. NPDC085665]|uniref:hypothetical protein n=1 Tax=Streptomyces sp. NPDC085665 TaxID=3365735 RepID=UPI0037D765E6
MCRGYADAYVLPAIVREALDLGLGYLAEVPEPGHPQPETAVPAKRGKGVIRHHRKEL